MSYQHKRSSVAGKVPTPADFKPGQIIVNITDGKLYMLVGTTVKSFSMDETINLLLGDKLDKSAQAADSAKLNNQTGAQWDAKIAAAGNWPGIYTGSDNREVNLPIGSYISVRGTAAGSGDIKVLNSTHVVRVDTNFTPSSYYTFSGTGLVLSGVWTSCGLSGATPSTNWPVTTMKRIA